MGSAGSGSAEDAPVEPIGPEHGDAFSPEEGPVERLCRWICAALIFASIAMVAVDVLARSLLSTSIQITNEVGGYMLLAVTFLSMSTCQVRHAYHRFQVLDARLSASASAVLRLVFDAICTVTVMVLIWQFARFELASLRNGEVAPTMLLTPLWIPRAAMLLGALALLVSMLRTVSGDIRRVGAASGTKAA